MSSIQSLEHHEHAAHIAHGGEDHGSGGHGMSHGEADARAAARFAQWTALAVACFAAGLAICEQGAKHAEIKVQQRAVDAADTWAQYQGKSTRSTVAKDVAAIVTIMDVGSDPAAIARRDALVAQLHADQESYDHDPKDGKDAIAHRARHLEEEREHAFEQTHTYHNGSAAYELGIVLATASAITRNRALIYVALALGVAGVVFSLLGYFAPELGAL